MGVRICRTCPLSSLDFHWSGAEGPSVSWWRHSLFLTLSVDCTLMIGSWSIPDTCISKSIEHLLVLPGRQNPMDGPRCASRDFLVTHMSKKLRRFSGRKLPEADVSWVYSSEFLLLLSCVNWTFSLSWARSFRVTEEILHPLKASS